MKQTLALFFTFITRTHCAWILHVLKYASRTRGIAVWAKCVGYITF